MNKIGTDYTGLNGPVRSFAGLENQLLTVAKLVDMYILICDKFT